MSLWKKLFGPSLEDQFLDKIREVNLEEVIKWRDNLPDLTDVDYDTALQYLTQSGADVEDFGEGYCLVEDLDPAEAQEVIAIANEYDMREQYLAVSDRIRRRIDTLDASDPHSLAKLIELEQHLDETLNKRERKRTLWDASGVRNIKTGTIYQ